MSSGLDITIPCDQDWTVQIAPEDGNHAALTLIDRHTNNEITLRGAAPVLIGLLETALVDLVDINVLNEKAAAAVDPVDAKLAQLQGHTERAMEHLENALRLADHQAEVLATPDEIREVINRAQDAGENFPEVRFGGEAPDAGWMPVYAISAGHTDEWRTLHCFAGNGDAILKSAARTDTLPVRRGSPVATRPDPEAVDLKQQRARDFGHDDPTAAA